jgi:hypothetical protein
VQCKTFIKLKYTDGDRKDSHPIGIDLKNFEYEPSRLAEKGKKVFQETGGK